MVGTQSETPISDSCESLSAYKNCRFLIEIRQYLKGLVRAGLWRVRLSVYMTLDAASNQDLLLIRTEPSAEEC